MHNVHLPVKEVKLVIRNVFKHSLVDVKLLLLENHSFLQETQMLIEVITSY